jgi:hypothetical protein
VVLLEASFSHLYPQSCYQYLDAHLDVGAGTAGRIYCAESHAGLGEPDEQREQDLPWQMDRMSPEKEELQLLVIAVRRWEVEERLRSAE